MAGDFLKIIFDNGVDGGVGGEERGRHGKEGKKMKKRGEGGVPSPPRAYTDICV